MSTVDKHAPEIVRPSGTLLSGTFARTSHINIHGATHVGVELNFVPGTSSGGLEWQPLIRPMGGTDAEWTPFVHHDTPGTPGSGVVDYDMAAVVYVTSADAQRIVRIFAVPVGREFCVQLREGGTPSPFGSCEVRLHRSRL
jgi:hypothetical protein